MGGPHTPGPWAVSFDRNIFSATRTEWHVATVASGWPGQPDEATADANARLIAAAPELLEALTTARIALIAVADSAVEAGFDQLADIIDEQLSKANDAIARATGAA